MKTKPIKLRVQISTKDPAIIDAINRITAGEEGESSAGQKGVSSLVHEALSMFVRSPQGKSRIAFLAGEEMPEFLMPAPAPVSAPVSAPAKTRAIKTEPVDDHYCDIMAPQGDLADWGNGSVEMSPAPALDTGSLMANSGIYIEPLPNPIVPSGGGQKPFDGFAEASKFL